MVTFLVRDSFTYTINDGQGGYDTATVMVTVKVNSVTEILVNGESGNTVVLRKGYLQMEATINPENASIKTVTWSVLSERGVAKITSSGLLKGIKPGEVKVIATANDGSGVSGS